MSVKQQEYIKPKINSKFSVGDTIVCALNLKSKPLAELFFQKNGTQLGIAKRFDSGPKGLEITDSPLKKLSWESTMGVDNISTCAFELE